MAHSICCIYEPGQTGHRLKQIVMRTLQCSLIENAVEEEGVISSGTFPARTKGDIDA
jgi:hypothetical protein